MITFAQRLFDTSDFMPLWACGNWSPFEGWLHVVADGLIFVAFTAIPAALFVLLRSRRDTVFPAIGWLFVAFILSCGITHAIEASVFWWPAYRLSGVAKAFTAVLSLTSAAVLLGVMPRAIALPSIQRANDELQQSFERERLLHEKLAATHAELERRASRLTVRERRMREALGAAKACAITWELDSNRIILQLGFYEATRSARLDWKDDVTDWIGLVGPDNADRLRSKARQAFESGSVLHHTTPLRGHGEDWDLRITATPEPAVAGHPAVMTGVAGLIPRNLSDA